MLGMRIRVFGAKDRDVRLQNCRPAKRIQFILRRARNLLSTMAQRGRRPCFGSLNGAKGGYHGCERAIARDRNQWRGHSKASPCIDQAVSECLDGGARLALFNEVRLRNFCPIGKRNDKHV